MPSAGLQRLAIAKLPTRERRPLTPDVHVQKIWLAGGEGSLYGGPDLIERCDVLTFTTEALHHDVVSRRAQFATHGVVATLQLALESPTCVVTNDHHRR